MQSVRAKTSVAISARGTSVPTATPGAPRHTQVFRCLKGHRGSLSFDGSPILAYGYAPTNDVSISISMSKSLHQAIVKYIQATNYQQSNTIVRRHALGRREEEGTRDGGNSVSIAEFVESCSAVYEVMFGSQVLCSGQKLHHLTR
jgi:hypothetical protein